MRTIIGFLWSTLTLVVGFVAGIIAMAAIVVEAEEYTDGSFTDYVKNLCGTK